MTKTKYTKGDVISREQAEQISKDYVLGSMHKDFGALDRVIEGFNKLKKGQLVLTFYEGQFIVATVSSVKFDWRNEDGPVIRVSDGKVSWRVDGNGYAVAIKQ